MVASKFAKQLIDAMPYGFLDSETEAIYLALDAELQEVREVVKLVAHPKFDAGGDGVHYYLTKADVQRARALLEKLEIRP